MTKQPEALEVIVRAVLRNGPRVLLAQMDGYEFWFLPGDTVRLGEGAQEALHRAINDELALDARIGDLVAVAENQYELDGQVHHELNLVFDTRVDAAVSTSHVPELHFEWFDYDALDNLDIRPAALAGIVRYGPGTSRLKLLSNGL